MTAVVEIDEERTALGFAWAVSWPDRNDGGYSDTYERACIEVGLALYRKRQSDEIHAYYSAHSHSDSGD